MATILVNDVSVHYERTGEHPGNERPPIILLHGLGHSTYSWRHIVGPLAEQTTVYAIDLPGHGQSAPITGSYHPRALAKHVHDWWRALALPAADWGGSAIGGDVVLWLALEHPDAVHALVVINGGGYPEKKSFAERFIRLPVISELLFGGRLGPTQWRTMYRNRFNNIDAVTTEELDEVVRRVSAPGVFDSVRKAMRAIDRTELGARIRQIKVPTLLLWGENDLGFPLAVAERMRRDIDNAKLVSFSTCGHYPHEEKPAETVAALARFLGIAARARPDAQPARPKARPPGQRPGQASPRRTRPGRR